MFKATSESLSYIERVSSHATKPRRNGLINDLPEWAREPEEYYNSLRERYDFLICQIREAQARVSSARRKLSQQLPYAEAEKEKATIKRDGHVIFSLQAELTKYRPLTRAAAMNSWGIVYFYVAGQLLDSDTRKKIDDSVQAFLGRDSLTDGIAKPRPTAAEKSPARKAAEKRQERRRLDRRWRNEKWAQL